MAVTGVVARRSCGFGSFTGGVSARSPLFFEIVLCLSSKYQRAVRVLVFGLSGSGLIKAKGGNPPCERTLVQSESNPASDFISG
jgi:hypothetical protein